MFRIIAVLSIVALTGLLGCAQKQLSPEELAKLQGGHTTVVVYGFCIPADHLFGITISRFTYKYVVNDKQVGTIQYCGHATFRVPSGYWPSKFVIPYGFPISLPAMKFRPGATQYLYMKPNGNNSFRGVWVDKAQADEGIAAINKIGQVF